MKKSVFFGISAILVLYGGIFLAISRAQWFSWTENALSDLGNLRYDTAPIFNATLLIAGLLLVLYASIALREHAPKTAYFLAFTGFAMQLVGLLCENYGRLHFYVSVLLFVSLPFAAVSYFIEKRCYLTWLVFAAVPVWGLYFQGNLFPGVAIPEIFSSFVMLPWLAKTLISVWRG
ncbi:MAG: DUF998 domain-containing protein [Candidatus Methanomethyliaceae archaeon]